MKQKIGHKISLIHDKTAEIVKQRKLQMEYLPALTAPIHLSIIAVLSELAYMFCKSFGTGLKFFGRWIGWSEAKTFLTLVKCSRLSTTRMLCSAVEKLGIDSEATEWSKASFIAPLSSAEEISL